MAWSPQLSVDGNYYTTHTRFCESNTFVFWLFIMCLVYLLTKGVCNFQRFWLQLGIRKVLHSVAVV